MTTHPKKTKQTDANYEILRTDFPMSNRLERRCLFIVSLKTAIQELNTGIVEFTYPKQNGCTTEGEVVTYLKRLQEFEETGLEPCQIKELAEASQKAKH